MVDDCLTFCHEPDLLEMRLNTLNDVDDRFAIAEATHTHCGQSNELIFNAKRNRFAALGRSLWRFRR
ncbi:MAG: hypothetical protein ACI4R9_07135 [Kiritimatiellia bacterium]